MLLKEAICETPRGCNEEAPRLVVMSSEDDTNKAEEGGQADASGGGADTETGLEEHRPFVRELDRKFSSVYGFGGAAVLGCAGAVLLFAWWRGLLWEPTIWALTLTVGLVALFVLRLFVRRRAKHYLTSVRDYCRANEMEPAELREYFDGGERYPYFEAIFETIERRRQLRENAGDDSIDSE